MLLPEARGPFSFALTAALAAEPGSTTLAVPSPNTGLTDDDLQLSLWICYEMHYRGFDDVDSEWEWQPSLLQARAELEARFSAQLADDVVAPRPDGTPIAEQLFRLVQADDGPPLSRQLAGRATRTQFAEFVALRSVYHLKEADPHSWAIPRLSGRSKAALIEIQTDEYGNGSLPRMHSELFRGVLRELGLSDEYGYYLDRATAPTLAISNLISFFGLHRSRRGALVGHLAAFEMTSSEPNRRYARGLRRVGGSDDASRFYDEHVTADALHEQLAAHDLCGGLVAEEPELAADILFGAACALHLDNVFAGHVLQRWEQGVSALADGALVAVAS